MDSSRRSSQSTSKTLVADDSASMTSRSSPSASKEKAVERDPKDELVDQLCAPRRDPTTDPYYVDWDGPDDPANPRNFSRRRKWMLSMLGTAFCGCVSIAVSAYSISIGSMIAELGAPRILALLGVTSFTLTFGTAPLVLAPLSESLGRHILYTGSAAFFGLFILAQAVAGNIGTVVVARFFSGIGGSTGVAIVGGTLADVWDDGDRSLPMNIFSWMAFFTTGLGPVIFGFVEYEVGWRIVEWAQFALSGLLFVFFLVVSQETRAPVLLSRKAKRLRKETGDPRYYAAADAERRSIGTFIRVALLRPLRMLFTEPVVAAFSTWLAFCWSVLYIVLVSLPIVTEQVYGFNIWQTGLAFLSQCIGSVLALFLTMYLDRIYRRTVDARGTEARLYPALCAGVMLPIGLWWYAWTINASIHWVVPLMGLTIVYASLQLCYVSCFNYLADSYNIYAASALSAQTFLRNVIACVAPLFATQMYAALGFNRAGALLAAVGTVVSITPFFLYRYGARLRARSPFATALAAAQAEAAARRRKRPVTPGAEEKEVATPPTPPQKA